MKRRVVGEGRSGGNYLRELRYLIVSVRIKAGFGCKDIISYVINTDMTHDFIQHVYDSC